MTEAKKKKIIFRTKGGKKISFKAKKKVKRSASRVRRGKVKTRWNRFGNP